MKKYKLANNKSEPAFEVEAIKFKFTILDTEFNFLVHRNVNEEKNRLEVSLFEPGSLISAFQEQAQTVYSPDNNPSDVWEGVGVMIISELLNIRNVGVVYTKLTMALIEYPHINK